MTGESSALSHQKKVSKERFKFFGSAFLLTILGFVLAYQFVEPAPPKRISIATGAETGAYYAYGQRYRDILARQGVTLEVRVTAGSVENLRLLMAQENGVDMAFVQGGIGDPEKSENLTSLTSLYFEPLWVFCRKELPIRRLSDLKGLRLAVGEEGSGTRALALPLLAGNGIKEGVATIIPLGGEKAAEALIRAEIDVAFFVISPQSPVVRRLMENALIVLLSFERAEAYTRVYRFLSKLRLPEGIIDFERNIPSEDVMLVASAANLVSRKQLHPALIDLLLQAAGEIHSQGGMFEELNEFPSEKYLTFPLHEEAARHFKSGPSFLQRYLPFWAATLIDRTKVMLLPLITLLIPLMKVVPPGYRWRVRRRIVHWYKELQIVDIAASEIDSPDQLDACMRELYRIEREVRQVTVPLGYAAELYNLRQHIRYVMDRITSTKGASSARGGLSSQGG